MPEPTDSAEAGVKSLRGGVHSLALWNSSHRSSYVSALCSLKRKSSPCKSWVMLSEQHCPGRARAATHKLLLVPVLLYVTRRQPIHSTSWVVTSSKAAEALVIL